MCLSYPHTIKHRMFTFLSQGCRRELAWKFLNFTHVTLHDVCVLQYLSFTIKWLIHPSIRLSAHPLLLQQSTGHSVDKSINHLTSSLTYLSYLSSIDQSIYLSIHPFVFLLKRLSTRTSKVNRPGA